MRVRTTLLLPPLLCLAPLASACSLVPPVDHRDVVWADDARVLTNKGAAYGWQPLGGGAFEALMEPFALMGPRVSPDGAWVVWQEAEGLGGDCSPLGGVVKAREADGVVHRVLAESVGAYAAGPAHLAVALHGRPVLRLYGWGGWDAPREVALDADRVGRVEASPEGGWFAVGIPSGERVALLDAEEGRVVGTIEVGADVAGLAFSPDGGRLAVLGMRYGEEATLRVHRLPGLEVVAERSFAGAEGATLAWGPDALGLVVNRAMRDGEGGVTWNATVHVLRPDDLATRRVELMREARVDGDVAFTPDGRLVFGVDGTLRVLGDELREVGRPGRALPTASPVLLAGALVLAALAGRAGVRRGQR